MGSSSSLILLIGIIGVYYLFKTGQLQPLLAKLGLGGGVTPPTTAPTPTPTTPAGEGGEIYQKVKINNNAQLIEFRFDTGADYSIIRTESAKLIGLSTANPTRTQDITTVSGTVAAPVVQVTMQIGTAQPFQTELIVMASNFNLLSRNDLNKVFDITISATGTKLTPKVQSAYAYAHHINDLRMAYLMKTGWND